MGVDELFESLVQLINTSKPIKIGLLKNINNFTRLAFVRFERSVFFKSPTQLSKTVGYKAGYLPLKYNNYGLKKIKTSLIFILLLFCQHVIHVVDIENGIRLYSVDSVTIEPSKLLLTHDIIVSGNKGDEWVEYEFVARTQVPKNGFYVAMEWLPNSQRYLEEKLKNRNGVIVANGQVLKGKMSKRKK